ncbi:helix-turn-helix domain-containing protein [Faecalibaculum rodentium]|uniref:helix-turn-helix domain-containing protein n=1 Tax=Faecalibaculum rodentium TaxID=1702221 RepID=UPI0025B74AF4|nr:helix-turn-helix transcriptional regulator [Faecalibaculum rodentium]
MLTEFGKEIRKLRIEHNDLLKNMADKLGVTSSYVSAIEHGKKPIPADFISRLKGLYDLSSDEIRRLEQAKEESALKVNIDLAGVNKKQAILANAFARKLNYFSDEEMEEIMRLIDGD